MNDNEIRTIAEHLTARDGLIGLQRLLGFAPRMHAPLRPSWSLPVRSARSLARGTLRLHVIAVHRAVGLAELRRMDRDAHDTEPFAHHVLIVSEPDRRRIVIACDALRDGVRHIDFEPGAVRPVDIDVLRELAARPDEHGTAAALRIHNALCRSRLTDRFFRDVRGVRDAVSRTWTGIPQSAVAERDALALILLSRLMFLYFLQHRGLLGGNHDFLLETFNDWRRTRVRGGTFFRRQLRELFFGVLNRRPADRSERGRAFGALPYLNGGLFERQRIERARPLLDLDDDCVAMTFDSLLQKYRFTAEPTTADAAGIGAGIDPEMLGRIYEGLMPSDSRSTTGSFYTPAAAVDALVVDVLAAHLADATGVESEVLRRVLRAEPSEASDRDLVAIAGAARRIRILDPACGSGALLIGSLARLEIARSASDHGPHRLDHRREIVGSALHGVDLLQDAALICSLRLWLALIPPSSDHHSVPPLPNLDRRIRQGDALVDPLDLDAMPCRHTPRAIRPVLRRLEPAARAYLTADPRTRPHLRKSLAALERRLARTWLTAQRAHLDAMLRELDARSRDTDLFGMPAAHARTAHARMRSLASRRASVAAALRNMERSRELPFFSFRVHFAETPHFDVVLSNPPWVRAHRWPAALRAGLRRQFRVCTNAGWPGAAAPAGAGSQVDLAFLFLERAVKLLRPRGTLGMVLPAKLLRSLAPGGARALLLQDAELLSIEDHSLDQRAIFAADSFTAVVVARRRDNGPIADALPMPGSGESPASTGAVVRIRMTRGPGAELAFSVPLDRLPLRPGDDRSPWLVAPPSAAAALRVMQRSGTAVGDLDLVVRRGAMTTANDVMIVRDVSPKLGDLAHIRTDGYHRRTAGERRRFSSFVEASALRPIVRGTDVLPWHIEVQRYVIWSPVNDDRAALPGPRLAAYLRRHAAALGPACATGALQRLSSGMFGSKVVWSDLAPDLRASAVPAAVRSVTGTSAPVVPLNTVYFIPTQDDRDACLLAGYLNSMPLRTFARTIAERAKDAHFRFFAWTISALPLPPGWRTGPGADAVAAISSAAHAAGAIDDVERGRLDETVARMYGLGDDETAALASFDAWLAGRAGAA